MVSPGPGRGFFSDGDVPVAAHHAHNFVALFDRPSHFPLHRGRGPRPDHRRPSRPVRRARRAQGRGRSNIYICKFVSDQISKTLTIEQGAYYRIAVSPDERTILYGQNDQAGSDLMLVENFR
jgi:hypothetical protein